MLGLGLDLGRQLLAQPVQLLDVFAAPGPLALGRRGRAVQVVSPWATYEVHTLRSLS